jgi:hypothetical protein
MLRDRVLGVLAMSFVGLAALADAQEPDGARLARQAAAYAADVPKTIVELQPFRTSESAPVRAPDGRTVTATLINLNPRINSWFLLQLDWGDRRKPSAYHLENPRPREQVLHLAPPAADGTPVPALTLGDGRAPCGLWSGDGLESDKLDQEPYARVCDGRLYVRRGVRGAQTGVERATELLRDHVPGSEFLIDLVKRARRDHFLDAGTPRAAPAGSDANAVAGPQAAAVSAAAGRAVAPDRLGIEVDRPAAALQPGRWYPARNLDGVFAGYFQPRLIAPEILRSHADRVAALDEVESGALAYLAAFDLAAFELGFAIGTDHPRVGWSERPPATQRDPRLPGPDGIGAIAPLVGTGMISPALADRAVASFVGGFKRQHGAFRYGTLAEQNHGSHYGFIEHGTVLSKLQPGLATLYVLDDGSLGMKTWSRADDALLGRIRHARQNGVALIEPDPATGSAAPGALVNRWGPGNWSGSADGQLRSVRAGACLQETGGRRFLIYGYFSAATPAAMARVFQAYGCGYAMLLDMNALALTYLAVYVDAPGGTTLAHLVRGMDDSDGRTPHGLRARFLQVPDDRDFFYVVRRERATP